MNNLEEQLNAEKLFSEATKGAGIYTLTAIIGELIGSNIMLGASLGGLIADVGIVVYQGIKINIYRTEP